MKRPLWITAKYASRCRRCDGPIFEGERVVYFAKQRAVVCAACAEPKVIAHPDADPVEPRLPSSLFNAQRQRDAARAALNARVDVRNEVARNSDHSLTSSGHGF